MSARSGLNPGEFLASLQGLNLPDLNENSRMLTGDTAALLAVARHLAATMSETGLIQQIPAVRGALDGSYLGEASP